MPYKFALSYITYACILVGGIPTPLTNMKVNGTDDILYIMENYNKTCLKPPTSDY